MLFSRPFCRANSNCRQYGRSEQPSLGQWTIYFGLEKTEKNQGLNLKNFHYLKKVKVLLLGQIKSITYIRDICRMNPIVHSLNGDQMVWLNVWLGYISLHLKGRVGHLF